MSGGEIAFVVLVSMAAVVFYFADRQQQFWDSMTLEEKRAYHLARTGHTLNCHYRTMEGYDCVCREPDQENPA